MTQFGALCGHTLRSAPMAAMQKPFAAHVSNVSVADLAAVRDGCTNDRFLTKLNSFEAKGRLLG